MKAYRRALTVDPGYVTARQALVNALLAMDRVDEALRERRNMPASKSASGEVPLSLIHALVSRTARQDPSEQNWEPVEQALDLADKAHPDSPAVAQMRAQVLVAQQREEAAEDLLQEACRKHPKQARL